MYSPRVEQAIRAASVLHQDQRRKGMVLFPHISHLVAVALITAGYTEDEDIFIAALLHDTLEDTDYTAAELEADFGRRVREIVETVSEPKSVEGKEYSWKERKQCYAKQLKDGPIEALIVSAADKIHNMGSVPIDFHNRYDRFLAEFGGSLDDRVMMYQDIANTLNRRLKNDILSEFNHVFSEYKNFIADVKKSQEQKRY